MIAVDKPAITKRHKIQRVTGNQSIIMIQCGAIMMQSIFSKILTTDTPYLTSEGWASYGVPVVIMISDSLSATVIAVSYIMSR